jgi:peptidoglycan/xylan/chitin deacetylase (PgdA/CDA1 family)
LSGLDRVLRWSPLQYASIMRERARPAVLAFHGVDDPEGFAGLMDRVRRDLHPISPDELHQAMNGRRSLPERSVLVTFDDGHRSVLDDGLPILAERGIPAVAFVVAGLLSTDRDFWWSSVMDLVAAGGSVPGNEGMTGPDLIRHLKRVANQARIEAIADLERSAGRPPAKRPQLTKDDLSALQRGGIEIGNHTWSHPCLNRCDESTIESEIVDAHRSLAQTLGAPPKWFAYPNGDWDERAEAVLTRLGYQLAFLFDHRMADLAGSPLRVSRLRVNSDTSTDRFAIISSGLHPAIHRARGRS